MRRNGTSTSQSSPETSRNEKQQFSKLIKVLRPKVYITDTSKFKTLVQELTGNGKGTIFSPPETTPVLTIEKPPVIDIEGQEYDHHESSMEALIEGYVDSFDLCNIFQNDQEVSQVRAYNQQRYMDDISTFDHMSLPMDQGEEFLFYRDLKSWLLSSEEPSSSCNGCCAQPPHQVKIYDYSTSYRG